MTPAMPSKGKDTWVGYRPAIKIHDCTVRDGGLINDHHFDDDFVRAVYKACLAAGVDYMEIGYKADRKIFSGSASGPWKYCDEEDLRRIVGDDKGTMRLSVMADAERTDYHKDILPKKDSVLDCIRVACYINQIPLALDMVRDAHDKGYETTLNLMAASVVQDRELSDALELIARSPADAVILVDSFGAFYSEQIRDLTLKYLRAVDGTGKEVGIHAHNNQQLAYANTIEALVCGANRLDATINGLGRGAGNCPLELLIGFLKNPKFHLRPILDCIEKVFDPLRKKMDWGYSIPYMITGQMNRHPRAAIKWRSGPTPDGVVAFYDQMIEEQ
jgi:4-hydroxy 2-oxovalerate aldolase